LNVIRFFRFDIISWLTLLAHTQDIAVRPANSEHSDGAHLLNELLPLWSKRGRKPSLNWGGGYRTIFASTLRRAFALPHGLACAQMSPGFGVEAWIRWIGSAMIDIDGRFG
jgi:hypothetical protein